MKTIGSVLLLSLFASQAMAASLVNLSCRGKSSKFSVEMLMGEQPGQTEFPIEGTLKISGQLSDGSQATGDVDLKGTFSTRDKTIGFGFQEVSIKGRPFVIIAAVENFKKGSITLVEGTLASQKEVYLSEEEMICKSK